MNRHEKSSLHQNAMKTADEFLQICNQKKKPIIEFMSQEYAQKIEKNRAALLSILDVIISLAQRGVPLRGNWCKEKKEEDSNFTFFLKWKFKDNTEIATFLKNAPRNATHLLPQIQNQLIDCLAHIIRNKIVQNANEADFLSIMADETCDVSTTEQMAVAIRYLRFSSDGSREVAEDFLGFVQLKETNAEGITDALLTNLGKWNVDVRKLRGKGIDRASTMSGHVSGVKTRIQKALPQAKYFTHCRNHCLNLVVVNSCKDVS